ncbi:Acyl-CoA N-acyltransferase [Penicillium fimorum]|uniref:Acyl-CoA N-acyltransferase n=1 Tax=Penicillium fimorum TaxID=1882269 RepID=A0A9W9Y3Z4_9EURO|nr:Acyl-CoA N-acyltransferase [Penicillium fimorum]
MAEEVKLSVPFYDRNNIHRKPPKNFDKPKSTVIPTSSSSAMLHIFESIDEMERNKLIQSIENLSWKQTWDLTKQFDKQRRKNKPVQQLLFGMENESHSCPEMLPQPGMDLESMIVEGVPQPEPWATSGPPDFIPDDAYEDSKKTVKKSNNLMSRAYWDARHKIQVKAYGKSRRVFPSIQDGTLMFTSESHSAIYEPEKSLLDDCALDLEGHDDHWHELKHRISSFDLPNAVVRNQFRNWWDQLPAGRQVDIYHAAFFDGTAMPDGQSSMFLPDIKHIPAPRDMKDEPTRLHWHETSEGYVYNLGKVNKRRKKKEQEQRKHLRRTAAYRAWLELPPDSKVVPPGVYLRPAEQCDASSILEIMNWYAQNSTLSSGARSMNAEGFEELLQFCRDNHFPFVVASQRPPEPLCRNQIHPVVGYAYVEFHRHGKSKSADMNMGELHVFIREGSKNQHIGRALVDMVLSCFDVNSGKSTDYEFDQTGTVQYGPGYGCHPTTLICAIATSQETEEHAWIKKWLKKDFGFEDKCVFENARVNTGKR